MKRSKLKAGDVCVTKDGLAIVEVLKPSMQPKKVVCNVYMRIFTNELWIFSIKTNDLTKIGTL